MTLLITTCNVDDDNQHVHHSVRKTTHNLSNVYKEYIRGDWVLNTFFTGSVCMCVCLNFHAIFCVILSLFDHIGNTKARQIWFPFVFIILLYTPRMEQRLQKKRTFIKPFTLYCAIYYSILFGKYLPKVAFDSIRIQIWTMVCTRHYFAILINVKITVIHSTIDTLILPFNHKP